MRVSPVVVVTDDEHFILDAVRSHLDISIYLLGYASALGTATGRFEIFIRQHPKPPHLAAHRILQT
jgi:hypothetical protein